MREIDAYTSPLDAFVEASDYALELPEPGGLVLIVDDEESSVALNRSILEAAGHDVRTFDGRWKSWIISPLASRSYW